MALAWKAGWVNSPQGFESPILRHSRTASHHVRRRSWFRERVGSTALPAPGGSNPVSSRRSSCARVRSVTVALFTLGGTISMAGVAPGGEGVVARLTGRDLTAAVPGLADLGEDLEIHDVEAVPSASLTFAQVLDVAAAASRAIEAGARGVVLSQGTDTLEETAFLVDLVWAHAEPFVVTGAMRNPTLAGPDGPANLLAAARVAASPTARELGALVVLNDEIHAARWVRKQHSTSTATFGSADAGPLGHVIEGRVRLLTRLLRPQPLPVPDRDRLGARRVALHVVSLEDDGDRLDGLADTHH